MVEKIIKIPKGKKAYITIHNKSPRGNFYFPNPSLVIDNTDSVYGQDKIKIEIK
jgi:hypothetical protein